MSRFLTFFFIFVIEMLGQFMQTEKLEGKIYACEECNSELSPTYLLMSLRI